MSNPMDFDNNENRAPGARSQAAGCADWGALLPEAAEDLLGEVEAQALAVHLATCPSCEAELAEARRGAAWLSLLKEQTPEPSHDLVAGILARTTGAPTLAETVTAELLPVPSAVWSAPAGQPLCAPWRDNPGPVRQWLARWFGVESYRVPTLQPRLTMTAAMAFFSICLTLNMLGISVSELHAQDLHAIGLQRTMAGKGASMLRSLQEIRVVYRVESRVNDWLTASNTQAPPRSQQ